MMTTTATTATISAILKNPRDGGFASDSLVYRYPPQPRIDGLPGEEGTFNMCSFLARRGANAFESGTA